MAKVVYNEERCKSCGLCAEACPRKIVAIDGARLNRKGYRPAYCVDQEKCIGCAMCATMCPDCVIEVFK